jgi:malonyl-CoA O-methyltransferase
MIDTKQKIIKNFNKKSGTYSASAIMQQHIAGILANKLMPQLPAKILEVGCGTGFLSQHLIERFPDASLLITDVAPAMVAECQKSVSSHPAIQFACMDGEQLAVTEYYDLIVSSMTLHWFMDLQRSCIDITNQLKRGGQFHFSILGENSFHEWYSLCHEFKVPVATPLFPAVHLLQTMLPQVELTVETYQQTYANAHDFLRSLKKIGAISARRGYKPLPSGRLRQVLRGFNTKLTISFEVIYGKYSRK